MVFLRSFFLVLFHSSFLFYCLIPVDCDHCPGRRLVPCLTRLTPRPPLGSRLLTPLLTPEPSPYHRLRRGSNTPPVTMTEPPTTPSRRPTSAGEASPEIEPLPILGVLSLVSRASGDVLHQCPMTAERLTIGRDFYCDVSGLEWVAVLCFLQPLSWLCLLTPRSGSMPRTYPRRTP